MVRTRQEIIQAGGKLGLAALDLDAKLGVFDSLLPNVTPNLEVMKASDWARLIDDSDGLAKKLILLKIEFPTLNLEAVIRKHPRLLLWSVETLASNAAQIKVLLADAPRPEVILEELPEMLDPKWCISILLSVQRWYGPKRPAIEILQADPNLVRRAEAYDTPLEPVFHDGTTWVASSFSRDKRQPWQEYIDREVHKRKM